MMQTIIVSVTSHASRTTAVRAPSTNRQGSGSTAGTTPSTFGTKPRLTLAGARAGAAHQARACHRTRPRCLCRRGPAAHRDHASRRERGQLEGRELGCRVVAGSFSSLAFSQLAVEAGALSYSLGPLPSSQPGIDHRTSGAPIAVCLALSTVVSQSPNAHRMERRAGTHRPKAAGSGVMAASEGEWAGSEAAVL
jgi:hypothetical protein